MTNEEEVITGEDIPIEDEISHTEPSKGINLYIDPTGKKTTAVAFKLSDKEISLQTIREKGAEYEKLVIDGWMDKSGYEKVKKAKNEFLKTRTTLQKVAKSDVIDPINAWLKTYKQGLDEVSDECQVWQDKMQSKLTEIDNAFRIEQERKENEAKQLLADRSAAIQAVGSVYNPLTSLYTFPHDTGLLTNDEWLKTWDTDQWDKFLVEAKESYQEFQVKENIRLQEEAAELVRLKALSDKQTKLRNKELKLLGGEETPDGWLVKGTPISTDVISLFEDDEWETLIEALENNEKVISINGVPAPLPPDYVPFDNIGIVDGNGNVEKLDVTTAEEAVASYSAEPLNVFRPHNYINAPIKPKESEPKSIIEFENNASLKNGGVVGERGVYVTTYFNDDKPFIEHTFSKSTLRFFPAYYEKQANEGVTPIDKGYIEGLGLQYLVIKKQK